MVGEFAMHPTVENRVLFLSKGRSHSIPADAKPENIAALIEVLQSQ